MKRQARLASAQKWIPTYTGKKLLKGYSDHFGVHWQCAAIELKMLGIQIDPDYLARRALTDEAKAKRRKLKKQEAKAQLAPEHWHPYTDVFSAYLAGDFEAVHDLEMRSISSEDGF